MALIITIGDLGPNTELTEIIQKRSMLGNLSSRGKALKEHVIYFSSIKKTTT